MPEVPESPLQCGGPVTLSYRRERLRGRTRSDALAAWGAASGADLDEYRDFFVARGRAGALIGVCGEAFALSRRRPLS